MAKNPSHWQKGQSGNPKGKPKASWKRELEQAIRDEGERRGKCPFKRLAEIFFADNKAAVGIVNYFVPKLRTVDVKVDKDSPFRLLIQLPPPLNPETPQEALDAAPAVPIALPPVILPDVVDVTPEQTETPIIDGVQAAAPPPDLTINTEDETPPRRDAQKETPARTPNGSNVNAQ